MKLADKIILRLLKDRADPSEIMIPNFFHFKYEMDCFKLTKKQLVVEYEVKISRADYFNDFKKNIKTWKQDAIYKHHDVRDGKSANRFYFVVPYGLIKVQDVPAYAGLIYYDTEFDKLNTIKSAPLIHRREFDDYRSLAKSLSWREDRWRRKFYMRNPE